MARSLRDSVLSLPPYHLISWGSLLGMELYQSFIMTKICYLHLPRPQFTSLQKKVFPVYFSLQVGLVVLTTVTYPPRSVFSLFQRGDWSEVVPLAVNAVTAALNAWVYGPSTQRVMVERIHQETKDARKSVPGQQDQDPSNGPRPVALPISDDMKRLNRTFSRNHAMAIHLNAIAMIATVWYGFALASRMQIIA